jgi:phosphoserine phosphatase
VLYFLTHMTPAEVQALAEAANDANLGAALSEVAVTSPAARPGAAGVVQTAYRTGIRTTPEIANLMHTFQAAGIDVYVVSASAEDVVRVFATNPKYGYGLAPDHVLGIRLAKDESDRYLPALQAGWPVTVYHGKVDAIQAAIARVGGRGPVFVAGDSDGDYNMMTEFPDTQLVLIVNRLMGGSIGKLSAEAARELGRLDAKYLFQGRDENTGLWLPSEQTILLGKSRALLLP